MLYWQNSFPIAMRDFRTLRTLASYRHPEFKAKRPSVGPIINQDKCSTATQDIPHLSMISQHGVP
jgi:hypothetical protein